jgi:hypothetical protein
VAGKELGKAVRDLIQSGFDCPDDTQVELVGILLGLGQRETWRTSQMSNLRKRPRPVNWKDGVLDFQPSVSS